MPRTDGRVGVVDVTEGHAFIAAQTKVQDSQSGIEAAAGFSGQRGQSAKAPNSEDYLNADPSTLDGLKQRAWQAIRARAAELSELAAAILTHPELGYAEYQASAWLSEFLANRGFAVTYPYAGLATAFDARLGDASGPTIAFMAEYDALPDVGHGCGHNLIAAAAVGAALGVQAVLSQTGGTVRVIGTPAEEFLGAEEGKLKLLRGAAFAGVDVALMLHPFTESAVLGGDLGFVACDLIFSGRPAHAAADPWNGINALDGVLMTFNAINALRQQVQPDVRIHGIITDGGQAPNIIPMRAAARFMIRAAKPETLRATYERFKACARGAAEATGTTLTIEHTTTVYNARINPTLDRLITDNFALQGQPLRSEPWQLGGSSDFGNVSQALPAAMFAIHTHPAGIPWHSAEVAQASAEPLAVEGMITGACVLAGVAIDLLANPDAVQRVRADFEAGGPTLG